MSWLHNVILVLSYGVVAAAVGVALPDLLPGTDGRHWAALVIVAGVVGHTLLLRRIDTDATAEGLEALRARIESMETRLGALATEAEATRAKVDEMAPGRRGDLVQELQVLQSLLGRIAEKPDRSSRARAALAAAAGAVTSDLGGERLPPDPVLIDPDEGAHDEEHHDWTEAGPTLAPMRATTTEIEVFDILREALESNRVDLYLQPIVALPSRKTRYYEAYSRVRDENGAILVPDRYLPVAGRGGMLTAIDNLLLFRCLQLVRRLKKKNRSTRIFVNISANTLDDSEFLPQFIDFMEHNRDLGEYIVFEFRQSKLEDLLGPLEPNLARLVQFGFHFSLDHVTSLDLRGDQLAKSGFRFVKVPAATLLSNRPLAHRPVRMAALKQDLAAFDIALIVEKIEEERTVIDLLDHDVELGQGHLFGEPKPARDSGE